MRPISCLAWSCSPRWPIPRPTNSTCATASVRERLVPTRRGHGGSTGLLHMEEQALVPSSDGPAGNEATARSREEGILANVRQLTDQQQEVLRFAEALVKLQAANRRGTGWKGILEGQGFDLTEEEIAE